MNASIAVITVALILACIIVMAIRQRDTAAYRQRQRYAKREANARTRAKHHARMARIRAR